MSTPTPAPTLPADTCRLTPLDTNATNFLKTLTVWDTVTEPTRIPIATIKQWAMNLNQAHNYASTYATLATQYLPLAEELQTTQAKVEKLEDEKADLLLAARMNQERADQDLATIAWLERALDLAQAAAGTHPTTGGK